MMGDVTRILSRIEQVEQAAVEELLPLVYDELRRIASRQMSREKPSQTLQATALVHDAYLKLKLFNDEHAPHWKCRGHLYAAFSEAIRRILIDNARRKRRSKHGGDLRRVELDPACFFDDDCADSFIVLDEATRKLAAESPKIAKLVNLRFFLGFSHQEAAKELGISRATADRHWSYAKSFLYSEIEDAENEKK